MGLVNATCVVKMDKMLKYRLRMAKFAARDTGNDDLIKELDLKWMQRIRWFLLKHFEEASKGGADWPKLADSTIEARRRKLERIIAAIKDSGVEWAQQKSAARASAQARSGRARVAKGGSEFLILDETHVLKEAVTTPNEEMSIVREPEPLLSAGLTLAGGELHGEDSFTSAQLAAWHQYESKNRPARPVIVPLDEACWHDMIQDMVEIVMRICAECAA